MAITPPTPLTLINLQGISLFSKKLVRVGGVGGVGGVAALAEARPGCVAGEGKRSGNAKDLVEPRQE